MSQAFRVAGFEKAGAECAMNVKGETDDFVREGVSHLFKISDFQPTIHFASVLSVFLGDLCVTSSRLSYIRGSRFIRASRDCRGLESWPRGCRSRFVGCP